MSVCASCGMKTVVMDTCTYCGSVQAKSVPIVQEKKVSTVAVPNVVVPRSQRHNKIQQSIQTQQKKNWGRRFFGFIFFWFLSAFWLGMADDVVKSFADSSGFIGGMREQTPFWLLGVAFFIFLLASRKFFRTIVTSFVLMYTGTLLLFKPLVAPFRLALPLSNDQHLGFFICGGLAFLLWGIFLLRSYFNIKN